MQSEQHDQPIGVEHPLGPILHQDGQLATTAIQPVQPEGEIGRKRISIERVGESAVPATSRLPIMALQNGFATHEDFLVIRQGIVSNVERAQVAAAVDAAITWTHDLAMQVVLERQQAVSITGEQKAQATFRVDVPDHPCLRVIKVASTKVAKPGDIVDFTIRFDNLGDQAIKKVVLIDNLTTRLEYVGGTAQSSRPAEFSTERQLGRLADAEVGIQRPAARRTRRPGALSLPRAVDRRPHWFSVRRASLRLIAPGFITTKRERRSCNWLAKRRSLPAAALAWGGRPRWRWLARAVRC